MFQTPLIYVIVHVILGFIAYHDKSTTILLLFLLWQYIQLTLQIRIFAFTWTIKKGNSFVYTMYKILQFMVGYLLAMMFSKYFTIVHY